MANTAAVNRAKAEVRLRRETIDQARAWYEESLAGSDAPSPAIGLRYVGLLVVELDRRDAELAELGELLERQRAGAGWRLLWKRFAKRQFGQHRSTLALAISLQQRCWEVTAHATERGRELLRMQRQYEAIVQQRDDERTAGRARARAGALYGVVLQRVAAMQPEPSQGVPGVGAAAVRLARNVLRDHPVQS